jgi:hypothetical protein
MHTPLRWDADAGLPPSTLAAISMGENMIQPVSSLCVILLLLFINIFRSPSNATTLLHHGPAPTFHTMTSSHPCTTSSP